MRTERFDAAGVPAGATVHEPRPDRDRHVALLYFHGGGLLYGQRDDLPPCYLEMMLERGYTLYCLDYPLAPEAALRDILAGAVDAWRWFVEGDFARKGFEDYALFGRSAGAYLALLLAARVRHEADAPQPCAVVDFYGFHDLADAFVSETPAAYRRLPLVDASCAERLRGRRPVTSGPKATRFALYVHARQTGRWRSLLGVEEGEEGCFSCSVEDIAALPPLFVAASAADEDVPYRVPKALSRQAHRARMKTVYGLGHDFDRDVANPVGRQAYAEMLAWLDEVVSHGDR